MYVIRNKSNGLFFNNLNWVVLEKARIFKTMRDVHSFWNRNITDYYLTNGSNEATKGLASFESFPDRKMQVTNQKDLEIIELEIKIKGVVSNEKIC